MKAPIQDYLGPLRPPFLVINLSCVAAGAGAALWRKGSICWTDAALALIGAVCALTTVNALAGFADRSVGGPRVDGRVAKWNGSGQTDACPWDERRHQHRHSATAGCGTDVVALRFVLSAGRSDPEAFPGPDPTGLRMRVSPGIFSYNSHDLTFRIYANDGLSTY
jgi:hypothetical protein